MPYTHEWIRTRMPVLLTFGIGSDDQWLRLGVRAGGPFAPPTPQCVIVQGTDEAGRVVSALSNLKLKRGKPFGGALSEMWRG